MRKLPAVLILLLFSGIAISETLQQNGVSIPGLITGLLGQTVSVGSLTTTGTGNTLIANSSATVTGALFAGLSVSTQTAGGAGASVTALCSPLANRFATGGGCLCSGGVAITGDTGTPNCVTQGCVPTGWTCQEPGGTGGACSAYVVCSRLQ